MPIEVLAACQPEQVLAHIPADANLVVPIANGEPVGLLDAVEESARRLKGVRTSAKCRCSCGGCAPR